jgi:hypothetical protein
VYVSTERSEQHAVKVIWGRSLATFVVSPTHLSLAACKHHPPLLLAVNGCHIISRGQPRIAFGARLEDDVVFTTTQTGAKPRYLPHGFTHGEVPGTQLIFSYLRETLQVTMVYKQRGWQAW